MSYEPGLFYAFAKHSTTDWAWRYLIVFVNAATADEWWRAVTGSVAGGYTRFAGVQRVSPQFYIHNPDVNGGNIMQTINDARCASQFLGRVFFTLLNDRDGRVLSDAPRINYANHISGNGFFIRSLLQRDQYWFFNGERIVVSRDNRTKFVISIIKLSQNEVQGSVMIGTDPVRISVFQSGSFLNIQPDGSLAPGGGVGRQIMFSEFDGGFQIGRNNNLVGNQEGGGDRWELV